MTSPTATAEIERLAREATPGPWVGFSDKGFLLALMPAMREGDICEFSVSPSKEDAAYIAAVSPDVVLGLIEQTRRLEAEVSRLGAGLQAIVNCHSSLTRSQIREAAADIMNGRAGSWPDQSPFVVRAEAAEAALRAAEAERDAAKAALVPFARIVDDYEENGVWADLGDDYRLLGRMRRNRGEETDPPVVTIKELRLARAALQSTSAKEEPQS